MGVGRRNRKVYGCSSGIQQRKPALGARVARKQCALTCGAFLEECHYSCVAGGPKKEASSIRESLCRGLDEQRSQTQQEQEADRGDEQALDAAEMER